MSWKEGGDSFDSMLGFSGEYVGGCAYHLCSSLHEWVGIYSLFRMLVTCGNLREPSLHGMVVVELLLFGGCYYRAWKSMTCVHPKFVVPSCCQ